MHHTMVFEKLLQNHCVFRRVSVASTTTIIRESSPFELEHRRCKTVGIFMHSQQNPLYYVHACSDLVNTGGCIGVEIIELFNTRHTVIIRGCRPGCASSSTSWHCGSQTAW